MKDYKIIKFENGATIVLKPKKDIKFTSVFMGFKTGAHFDEVAGTAHFLEHNLFLGTNKRTREQIDKDNSNICMLNASTSLYYMVVKFKRANSELDNAFEFASDILLNTKFNNNELKKEREVVRNEILMSMERDKRSVYAYHNMLWSNYLNTNACAVIGTDIDKVTKKDMEKYRDKYYVASNFVMYVYSSLPMSKIVKFYKKYILPQLKEDNNAELINYDMTPTKPSKMQVVPLDQDKIDVVISIDIPFGICNTKNRFCKSITRLYLSLEQPYNTLRKKGLIYTASVTIAEYLYNSRLNIRFICSKENVNKIIDEYAKELQNLYKNGMDKEIFENLCKQMIIADNEKESDFAEDQLFDTIYMHLISGLVDEFDLVKEAKKITLEEVNKYISLFNNANNKIWVTVLGNIKEKDVYSLQQIQRKFFTAK